MDRASFHPSDPVALVEASLSCPLCLHAVTWRIAGGDEGPTIACRCSACGHERPVRLSAQQLLRLSVPDDEADGLIIGAGLEAGWPPLSWPA